MDQQFIYSFEINCNDCNFTLMVNDCPLLDFNRGANINTEIPANEFLQNELNEFTCKILPPQGQDILSDSAFVNIKILEGGNNTDEKSREISQFSTPSFKPDEHTQPYNQYTLAGKFSATVNYSSILPTGRNFVDSEYLHDELFQAYMRLWLAFQNKDIDAVMRLLSLKIKETAGLNGSSLSDMEKEFRMDYTSYMNDSSLQLWEFTPDKVFLKLYAYNKLACLEVKNGNQPICFINRPDRIAIYIPVYFSRNSQTNQLEIIR